MKKQKELKTKVLRVHMTPSEYTELREKFKSTTFRTFSQFIRSILRREPVIKRVRVESLDQIHESLVDLKNAMMAKNGSLSAGDFEILKFLLTKIYERCGQEVSGLQR